MKRRNFLRHGSLLGLTVAALPVPSISASKKAGPAVTGITDDFVLNEITIDEIQEQMQRGKLSAVAITQLYLQRIEAIDRKGPAINAVIEVNPDALAIAAAMDAERKAGKVRGPLHGIPVLIKDNIDTADKMMTTAGALVMEGNIAKQDAFIVKRLRDAGAVILGKTNLSEWANFRSTMSVSGWSSRGGQTKNPYILDRNPSGSSSGAGAAVAANLCVFAIGTETNGSIVSPASASGIVGIKPTVGLCSRSGIIPISHTQDTAGPMCRTVRDAAIVLGVLAGQDAGDSATLNDAAKTVTDYTQFLDGQRLDGVKIGVEKAHYEGNVYVVNVFRQSVDILKSLGAEIVELDVLKTIAEASNAELDVLLYEFKHGVNNYLQQSAARVRSLKEVIEYNREHEHLAMPFFRQELLRKADEKEDLESSGYKKALAKTLSSRKIINELMREQKLDVFCGVTSGPPCMIDLVNGDYYTGFFFSTPAAIAGFPHITVPMGFIHGLPVGISFFSGAFKEGHVLTTAYVYEQATKLRRPPMFKERL